MLRLITDKGTKIMISIYKNLTLVSYLEGELPNHGYKHLILSGISNYTAFKTDAGLNQWLERTQAKVLEERVTEITRVDHPREVIRHASLGDLAIHDQLFWFLNEIPTGATPYIDLCNGSLVTCYWVNKGGVHHVYRPNPNAKEVYTPLPLEEHIKYMSQFG